MPEAPGAAMDHQVPTLDALAALVWQLSAELRHAAHEVPTGCRTRRAPYGPEDPQGVRLPAVCRDAGCLDIVHDILLVVRPRLDERWRASGRLGAPRDPLAYANGAVRRAVADLRRSRRVERGLPAKPARSDGTAGQVEAALRTQAADPGTVEWHLLLFRLVRSYPCRPGAAGRGWPLDAWAHEKTALDGVERAPGSVAARDEVSADIRTVLAVVDRVAGAPWRYRTITEPLRLGGSVESGLPDDELEHPLTGPLEEEVLVRLFEQCYHRLRSGGVAQLDALRAAADEVYGRDPQAAPRELRDFARDLDARRPSGPWPAAGRAARGA